MLLVAFFQGLHSAGPEPYRSTRSVERRGTRVSRSVEPVGARVLEDRSRYTSHVTTSHVTNDTDTFVPPAPRRRVKTSRHKLVMPEWNPGDAMSAPVRGFSSKSYSSSRRY